MLAVARCWTRLRSNDGYAVASTGFGMLVRFFGAGDGWQRTAVIEPQVVNTNFAGGR